MAYIDKEAYKEKYLCCGYLPEMSEEEFDAFPEVDVAPVVHGRWELVRRISGGAYWKCSVCGRTIETNMFKRLDRFPYCHCGAKMTLEE